MPAVAVEVFKWPEFIFVRHFGAFFYPVTKIQVLQPNSLAGLHTLRVLRAKEMGYEHLPDEFFKNTTKLKEISLSHNPLKTLPRSLLELPILEEIQLDETPIGKQLGENIRNREAVMRLKNEYYKIDNSITQ